MNCVIAFVPTVYYVQTVSSYVVFAVKNLAIGVALLEQYSLQATLLVYLAIGVALLEQYSLQATLLVFQKLHFNFLTSIFTLYLMTSVKDAGC